MKHPKCPEHEFKCPRCGDMFVIDQPRLTRDYYIWESPVHGCGPKFTGATLIAKSPKKVQEWNELFNEL